MPPITIYTKPLLPLLRARHQPVAEEGRRLRRDRGRLGPGQAQGDAAKSNGKTTYPQIFIGETHVGGCDDLMALDRAGELDKLLAA